MARPRANVFAFTRSAFARVAPELNTIERTIRLRIGQVLTIVDGLRAAVADRAIGHR